MSKSRILAAAARALPYKHPPTLPYKSKPPHPPSSPRDPPASRARRTLPYLVGGCAVCVFTSYTFTLYKALAAPPSSLPQDTDVSLIYNCTAATFDTDVHFTERATGILRERRRLTQKAHGHCLEVSAGTGRNSGYYDLSKCDSVTLLDLSSQMLDICRKKWMTLHPDYAPVAFLTQSALRTPPNMPQKGYTTILQTFGLCSTPDPTALLRHLGTLLDPEEGRVLLLEHGRGNWRWVNWVLDRTAGRHAERHGCWWNRDLERVVRGSGLVVAREGRRHMGTMGWWELRVSRKGEVGYVGKQGVIEGGGVKGVEEERKGAK